MSGLEEKKYIKKQHDKEENILDTNSSASKSDYCGMNIATFTFGGRQTANSHNFLSRQLNTLEKEHEAEQERVNNYRKTNRVPVAEKEKKSLARENTDCDSTLPLYSPTLINNIGSHNSFLSSVVTSIWNLSQFRNYILCEIQEKDPKYKLLYELKYVLGKMSQSQGIQKQIDISKLRNCLAECFQNRRKFLLDQPDDPVDCLFAILNSFHSYSMKNSVNEVLDTMCNNKCFSHKNFWIDLCRVEECECKGSSKRFFSHHNYIFDIPIDKLFELSNTVNLVEMSKSFKLKSGKFSEITSTEQASIADLKGKMFLYFKMLLGHSKSECPAKGIRCDINKTVKKLALNNLPNYLLFSLQKKTKNNTFSLMEILKTFILIPKIFDLSTIFDHNSKNKIFFEFIGGICIKPGKTFTTFFKSSTWNHNDDESVHRFQTIFELISHCLKNSEMPIMLFFQIQDKFTSNEKDILNDELMILERYARNGDNLDQIIQNRFRSEEEIVIFNPQSEAYPPYRKHRQNSKNSTSISTSNNNSNSRIELSEYICSKCFTKNRIESPLCIVCNKNNEDVIDDMLKKRAMNNYINIANFNLNINTGADCPKESNDRESTLKGKGKNNSINRAKGVVYDLSSDESLEGISNKKNLNMPKQISTKNEPTSTKSVVLANNKPGLGININNKKTSNPVQIKQEKDYDDRPVPFEIMKNKSRKNIAINNDRWSCVFCSTNNHKSEHKCQECKKLNPDQDNYNNNIKRENTIHNNSKNNSYKESFRSPHKEKQPDKAEKKQSDKKLITVSNTSPGEKKVKKTCICSTNYYTDNLIKNNICTICNRYVDSNSSENTLKKKYQQELTRHSNPSNIFKRNDSQPKLLKKDESLQNLTSKVRCPSNLVRQRPNSHSKFNILVEDVGETYMNPNHNPTNPFSTKNKSPDLDKYKPNTGRLNSTGSAGKKRESGSVNLGGTKGRK